MPVLDNNAILSGEAELSIGTFTIPPELLGDITPDLSEKVRERNSLAGKTSVPTRTLDNNTIKFTLFVPNYDYLKHIWSDMYNASAGGESGNLVFGGSSCSTLTPVVVNIHRVCEPDSRNDEHYNRVLVGFSWNPTYSADDVFSVEVTLHVQPDSANGAFKLGAGELTQNSLWDATTQAYVAVTSS